MVIRHGHRLFNYVVVLVARWCGGTARILFQIDWLEVFDKSDHCILGKITHSQHEAGEDIDERDKRTNALANRDPLAGRDSDMDKISTDARWDLFVAGAPWQYVAGPEDQQDGRLAGCGGRLVVEDEQIWTFVLQHIVQRTIFRDHMI